MIGRCMKRNVFRRSNVGIIATTLVGGGVAVTLVVVTSLSTLSSAASAIGSLVPPALVGAVLWAIIALTLIGLGPSLPATAVLLVLWGLIATSAPVAWWTWLARTLPDEAEAGGGLMVAIVQLAITLGATVGGVLYDHRGHSATFGASAVVLVLAAGLARQAGRSRAQGATGQAPARSPATHF